jgi:hypothetical protein
MQELRLACNMIQNGKHLNEKPMQVLLKELNGYTGWSKELVIKFSQATDKQDVMNKIVEFMQHVPKSRVMHTDALAIADEFFTNAIFHSPSNSPSEKQQPALRERGVSLSNGVQARLIVAHNDEGLFVGTEDPFGSLNLSAVFNRYQKCFEQGIGQSMNMGPGGAGIGLFMLYNLSVSMVFCVQHQRSSFLGCFLPLGKSLKQKDTFGKCIHICEQ